MIFQVFTILLTVVALLAYVYYRITCTQSPIIERVWKVLLITLIAANVPIRYLSYFIKDDLIWILELITFGQRAMLICDFLIVWIMIICLYQLYKKMRDNSNDTTKLSSDVYNTKEKHDAFLEFLNAMNFKENFQRKLCMKDAITIRQTALTTDKNFYDKFDLPYIVLQKIMMSDRKSRSVMLQNQGNLETEDSDDEDNYNDGKIDTIKFHPIDCMITLLLCCDNLLRQDLINKLLSCQLAVPLVLPNPSDNSLIFLLWGMRSVVRSWKAKKLNEKENCMKVYEMEKRMIDHQAPIIAFIRIGKVSSASKSEYLNGVISGESTFFCWNFEGGSVKRRFVDGLIELCWYLPACQENSTDIFPDAMAFINLRGDAQKHPKQLQLIQKISYLVVVLTEEETINNRNLTIFENLAKTPGGIILLPFDESNNRQNYKSTKIELLQEKISKQKFRRIKLKGKSRADVITSIQQNITKKITSCMSEEISSISSYASVAAEIGIKVDEYCDTSIEGKQLAIKLMDQINSVQDVCKIKQEMLPLQGQDLWHQWAKYDKERNRHTERNEKTIATHNSDIDNHKKRIRKKQLNISKKYTAVMGLFIQILSGSKPDVRTYFLQWLKIFLDDHSRKILPKLHAQYQKTRKEYLKEKDKENPDSNQLKNLQKQLKKQNEHLIHATFGLEHLFREMAQIYEARMDPIQNDISDTLKNEVVKFPYIMAEIMKDGHSLELMDGDASHVPITWVKAVIQSLKQQCKGRDKLYVLSVLGIQSTGKSTLLNTLFGLRFNVSAGRCTRGAFIQMLPLDSKLKNQIECDNILIVDTEGLRAPELQLEGLKHDNELATFVIGVADSTMINIFGEVPGDLNDILQTSIHAFIRMKKVDMNPSCMFVHQNVPDIMAKGKGLVGRQNFQAKLDEMTQAAAEVEQCDNHFKKFQDVIYFNDQTDVFYFPSLWKGDPPMAPVNPGYSEKAQTLKNSFIKLITEKKDCRSSFEGLDLRITNIWSAVLQENFVFSFKNTLEVAAYNELDSQYGIWSWELQNAMLEWQQKARTKIENFDCTEAKQIDNAADKTSDKTTDKTKPSLDEISKNLTIEANATLDCIYTNLLTKLKLFIDSSNFVQTLTQWKHSTERRLQILRDEYKSEAKSFCKRVVQSKLNNAEFEKLQNNKLDIIQVHIQELVQASWEEGKELSDTEIEIKFKVAWDKWMKKFDGENQIKFITDEDMEIAICQCLREKLHADDKSIIEKLTKLPLNKRYPNLTMAVDGKVHLKPNSLLKYFTSASNSDVQEAIRLSSRFLRTVRDDLNEFEKNNTQFEKPLVVKIINKLFSTIDKIDKKTSKFLFTPAYKVEMAIIICTDCLVVFKRIMSTIRKENDPVQKLNALKDTFLESFKSQYTKINAEKSAANSLCIYLIQPIKKKLQGKLEVQIVSHLKDNDPHFHSKRGFKVKILTTLAEKGKFSYYRQYFDDIESSVRSWAEYYINNHCQAKDSTGDYVICKLAEESLRTIIKKVKNAVNEMLNESDITSCLTNFHERLAEDLIINKSEMLTIICSDKISNVSFFVEAILEGIENIESNIKDLISEPSSTFFQMTSWSNPPHLALYNNLAGCCEICPFCREQCELADKKHPGDHSVIMHRPECLGRYVWMHTNELTLDLCTELVVSTATFENSDTNDQRVPYTNYKSIYGKWNIPTDKPDNNPVYWKWVVSEFRNDITQWANASYTPIPDIWNVSKDTAIKSLKKMYQFSG